MSREDAVMARAVERHDADTESLTEIRERLIREDPEKLPSCSECAGTGTRMSSITPCPRCDGTGIDDDGLTALAEDMWASEWDAGVDKYAATFEDPTPGWWEP